MCVQLVCRDCPDCWWWKNDITIPADWNPATDAQALARVWRSGQTKHCFIYVSQEKNDLRSWLYHFIISFMLAQRGSGIFVWFMPCALHAYATSVEILLCWNSWRAHFATTASKRRSKWTNYRWQHGLSPLQFRWTSRGMDTHTPLNTPACHLLITCYKRMHVLVMNYIRCFLLHLLPSWMFAAFSSSWWHHLYRTRLLGLWLLQRAIWWSGPSPRFWRVHALPSWLRRVVQMWQMLG